MRVPAEDYVRINCILILKTVKMSHEILIFFTLFHTYRIKYIARPELVIGVGGRYVMKTTTVSISHHNSTSFSRGDPPLTIQPPPIRPSAEN